MENSGTGIAGIPGHPLGTFRKENGHILALLDKAEETLADAAPANLLSGSAIRYAVSAHYAKKGNLLYPLLKERCPAGNPSDALWDNDVDVKNELLVLADDGTSLSDFFTRQKKFLQQAKEIAGQEDAVLYPLCEQYFSEEDWMRIYYEMTSYDDFSGEGKQSWTEAEEKRTAPEKSSAPGVSCVSAAFAASAISLGSGYLTPEQIEGVLNTIPMELTFIDDKDRNCYFNAGKKLFKRPDMAIGRPVFSCHPPRYETLVDQTIEDLRSGRKDSVDVWLNKEGEPVLVRYLAVRNKEGKYIGTLECVQKMGFLMQGQEAAPS